MEAQSAQSQKATIYLATVLFLKVAGFFMWNVCKSNIVSEIAAYQTGYAFQLLNCRSIWKIFCGGFDMFGFVRLIDSFGNLFFLLIYIHRLCIFDSFLLNLWIHNCRLDIRYYLPIQKNLIPLLLKFCQIFLLFLIHIYFNYWIFLQYLDYKYQNIENHYFFSIFFTFFLLSNRNF